MNRISSRPIHPRRIGATPSQPVFRRSIATWLRFVYMPALLACAMGSTDARADDWKVVIEDGFSIAPPGRIPGKALEGTAPETGPGAWRCLGNDARIVLTDRAEVGNGAAQGGKTVALVDCIPEGERNVKLEADVRPGGSMWVAVGFGGGDDFFWSAGDSGGQIWVTFDGTKRGKPGIVQLYANGASKVLKQIPAQDYEFDTGKPIHAELDYCRAQNTVSLKLNGRQVAEALPLGDFKPAIRTAGFMVNFPVVNDPEMSIDNFKISLLGGAWVAPTAQVGSGRPLILIDSSAVKRTNLLCGGGDLRAETSLEPSTPYFAEFDFGVAAEEVGEYDAWVLLLASNVPYISPWSWCLDGTQSQIGKALEGSLDGMPRWIKFGKMKLSQGKHTLRFDITGRRVLPDDAYMFRLWKVYLAPSDVSFSPNSVNVDLGFNPQANQRVATDGTATTEGALRNGRLVTFRSIVADPAYLYVDTTKVLPPVAPVWLDLSEGGVETGGDFIIPRLAEPLRPRFIRKCHVLSLASAKRGADGKMTYDFTESIAVVRAIRNIGAEPIIDLANVPGEIRKGIPQAEWASNAKFQAEWYEAIRIFLETLKKSGVTANYFTCFNEPEFSQMQTRGNDEAALTVYRLAAKAVKEFDPKLKMCGMEFGNAKSEIYNAFLNDIAKHPERVDVFSFHQYNSTPARLASEIRDLRKALDSRSLQHVKTAVDEWGIASAGHPSYRSGVGTAAYNASCLKAMAEAGLDIGGLFCFRDYPTDGWKWGLFTGDGFLKPSYWGQWLWAQLPEKESRLSITGGDDRVQAMAFRDGDGVSVLVWYDAPETAPTRNVSVNLGGFLWHGYTARHWQLDSIRHIGYIPEGAPIELPYSVKSEKFKTPAMPSLSFNMMAPSMRLVKIQPLADGKDPIPPRPILLDNERLSPSKFRALERLK